MTPHPNTNTRHCGERSDEAIHAAHKKRPSFLKKRSKRLLLMAVATLNACSPAQLLNSTISRADLTILHDISYGPHPRETLDIYRPARSGTYPVVVFFYGGAWNSGSKSMYPFVAATLARHGLVVIVPDYRLYPTIQYPIFLQDCAQAVAWTSAHMAQIGGNPRKLFLMGHSAGAYNALMLALDPALLAAAGTSRNTLAGAIGLAGPYDFLPMTGNTRAVFGPATDNPATQPITYADAHAPPLLLLAGTNDTTVRPRNTQSLANHIRTAGGQAETHFYPGVAHIGLVLAIAPLFQGKAPVLRDILAFIDSAK